MTDQLPSKGTTKDQVLCRWCYKRRRKLSGFQKRNLAGDLVEICGYCKRYHENVQLNNPLGGLLQELIPKHGQEAR